MTTTTLKPIICPSLLSSDFAFLARDANHMLDCGADWLHMDVMFKQLSVTITYTPIYLSFCLFFSHFVPNLTIGAPVIKSLRKHTKGHLDCHLMVTNPETLIDDFKNAGADGITFHIEATANRAGGVDITADVIKKIKAAGMQCGISIKPKTPVDVLFPFLDDSVNIVDFILIMTVEPGFGGQSFMQDMMPKVSTLRQRYPNLNIQVDGGIDPNTIGTAAQAGANIVVAGSSLFKPGQDPKDTIQLFKDTINKYNQH
ncbi:ribulose phosphate 3-epimerase [Cavenderia fasciculata]|uniref:Ribulose-phosphate 3-epimerase n=1 Tax=Cavenderia fasciculata TaxID=261658 RepID=F4QBP7_CACFS|nr:ribulose phosphate 3-epimerase [Cavenderia fasciculata]EGG14635.1 ribulose phosphate 3-epimerase [Cavenderia fasciculata]|eukprot:XP_004351143.1 ribulose phosphate 3-epimerase [Cavenderia fasciculata]